MSDESIEEAVNEHDELLSQGDKIKQVKETTDDLHNFANSYFEEKESYFQKKQELEKELQFKLQKMKSERFRELFSGMKKCSKADKVIPVKYIEELEEMIFSPNNFHELFDDLFEGLG